MYVSFYWKLNWMYIFRWVESYGVKRIWSNVLNNERTSYLCTNNVTTTLSAHIDDVCYYDRCHVSIIYLVCCECGIDYILLEDFRSPAPLYDWVCGTLAQRKIFSICLLYLLRQCLLFVSWETTLIKTEITIGTFSCFTFRAIKDIVYMRWAFKCCRFDYMYLVCTCTCRWRNFEKFIFDVTCVFKFI